MADQTIATANAILKEDYLGPLRTTLNTVTPVFQRLDKNTRDIVGKEAWIPLEMALNQGAGARAELAVLPTAGRTTFQELKVPLASYYGSMSISGQVMRQTAKGDKGSFGRIMDLEAKSMRRTLGLVLGHDVYLGSKLSDNGVTAASTTVVLASNANMEYYFEGMVVDIVITTTGVKITDGDSRTITAVDRTAKTITFAGAVVTTTGLNSVHREDTFGAAVTGLFDIIDDTADIYGVITANQPDRSWKSIVKTAVGPFAVSGNPKSLQATIDDIVTVSGKFPTAIYSDYALQRKYFETLTANPRYMQPTQPKVLDGGFRSLEYTGGGQPIPWIADRLMPAESLLLPHEPDIQLFTDGDFKFLEIGGDAWLPDILGSAAVDRFKAILHRDIQLGAYNRNSHGKMLGVT